MIRVATHDDVDALVALHLDTVLVAYRDWFPPDMLPPDRDEHVHPAHWGRGLGGALHDLAVDALRGAGHRRAGLWVIAANERARSLYERRGWMLDPTQELDEVGVREVRYTLGL